MKSVVFAGVLALSSTAAFAGGYAEPVATPGVTTIEVPTPVVSFFGSGEYQIEKEAMEFGLGADIGLTDKVTLTPEMTFIYVNDDLDVDSLDITVNYEIDTNWDVYGRVEFDNDLEYDEFAVGVKFTF